jgi:hypothetical protein
MNARTVLLPMRRLLPILALLLAALPAWGQQSALLESVRQNPQRGKALCQQLRQLNAQGVSFTSAQVTTIVAREQNLSPTDAEVLLTYVVGFYCPDVR